MMTQLRDPASGDDSASKLLPELAGYLKRIESTPDDKMSPVHQSAADRLGDWLAERIKTGTGSHVIIICTGNSRRSMLGAGLGNAISSYLNMPGISFHSGGTTPSAFNKRSIATLKRAGFVIEPTGKTAPAGAEGTENPIYRVRWSADGVSPVMESLEFSKSYRDSANPQKDFAAVLVCDEADAACPAVFGASVRIPAPFQDPKSFDGTPQEEAMYDTRRNDIARFMFLALTHARSKASAQV